MKKKKPVINTKTIGVNMNRSLSTELERRAKDTGVSVSLYCKTVLGKWVKSGETIKFE